jgi:hypothetical protein
MATRIGQVPCSNNTDANFRLWINEFNNAVLAMGWTATTDTGQINFSTVTRPTAINIYQGYAVYQMADSLQSSCAVFMRVDFGTQNGSTDLPSIKVQVCIGSTNGSGTLTGNLSTQVITGASGVSTNTSLLNVYTSGSSSRLSSQFWSTFGGGNLGWTLIVERDRNTSGAETSLGVNFLVCHCTNGGITLTSQFIEQAGGLGSQDSRWYAMVSSQLSQAGQGTAGVGTIRTQLGPFRNPIIGAILCSRGDFLTLTTNPIIVYGTSHTYLALRPNVIGIQTMNSWNTDCGIMMLWE